MTRLAPALLGFLIAVIAAIAPAEPPEKQLTVVRDYGNTRPSGIPDMEQVRKLAREMRVDPSALVNFPPYSFPIASSAMSVGNLRAPIQHGKKGVRPFFIIGGDAHSREWLARNKAYLLDQGYGDGLITNVKSAQEFKMFVDTAEPLNLHPMNVDEVARVFGVNVYPLLITPMEILQ